MGEHQRGYNAGLIAILSVAIKEVDRGNYPSNRITDSVRKMLGEPRLRRDPEPQPASTFEAGKWDAFRDFLEAFGRSA